MNHLTAWWQARQARQQWIADTLTTAALTEHPNLGGYDLMRRTGLPSGRLYKALDRLTAAGRVCGRWQDGPPPRRRLYRLTAPKEQP